MRQPVGLNRGNHLLGNVNRDQPIAIQTSILERVFFVTCPYEILVGKCIGVRDNQTARQQIFQVGDQCSWIHGDEDVDVIPSCGDFVSTEVNLEC